VLAFAWATAFLVVPAGGTTHLQSDFAESGLVTIRSLIDAGRYSDAESAAEALVAAARAGPEGAVGVDRAIEALVEALLRNGRASQPRTRALAEELVRSREARTRADDPPVASSLRMLGEVLVAAGEYQLARKPTERAVRIDEAALGVDHPQVADDLDNLTRVLISIEKYDDARAANDRALAIREAALHSDDVRLARTLEIRASLLQRMGDYRTARPVIERALLIGQRVIPSHPEMAPFVSRAGEQARLEGNLVEARQFSERALRLAEQTLRPDHPEIASYQRLLAIPLAGLGDLAGARRLRERAVGIAEKALGPEHLAVAIQLNDLGLSLLAEGEYARAGTLFERARGIYQRHLGPDHLGVTTAVYNHALVSQSLGDFAAARAQFTRTISTWERVLGPDHPFVALALTEFARMLSSQGLDREARTLYERALGIRERTLGKNSNDVARTETLLSNTLLRLRQAEQALELSSRALTIWEQSNAHEVRGHAESLRTHGDIQTALGDYEGAKHSYEHALEMLRPVVGSSHPDIAEIDVPLAGVLARIQNRSESLQYALEADEIGTSHLRLMLRDLPERQGLEYASTRPKGLDFALSLAAGGSDIEGARIFDQLIRSRGSVLEEMARRRQASADATRPELAPLWATLVSARQRYANLVIRGADEQHPERYAALVAAARRDTEDAERAFATKSVAFETNLSPVAVGLDEVRAAIPARGALVALVRYDRSSLEPAAASGSAVSTTAGTAKMPVPSYAAFVLRAGESQPVVVPLGAANVIEPLVARWREQIIAAVATESPGEVEQTYRAAGAALRRRVWDPIQKNLTGAAAVFIVPDGTLNLVSFAALPIGQTAYLIDRPAVLHYLSAERDLVSRERSSAAPGGLLAVGGPAYDADPPGFGQAKPRSASPVRIAPLGSTASLRSGCGDLHTLQFAPLAETAQEVHDIAQIWTGSRAEILEGRTATERAVKRDAPGHRVLHLATHGFFLGDCGSATVGTRSVGGLTKAVDQQKRPQTRPGNQPGLSSNPLLISGLALAGANRRAAAGPADEDGILTAEEVTTLNLDSVEWVVLSACDSGLGEVKAGEGVFGLRRAFQMAGARTVIMSLWSVDDTATRRWMRTLYRSRFEKHLTTAEAIHAASAGILRERRASGQSTHPFYWAAFVAAGDWR